MNRNVLADACSKAEALGLDNLLFLHCGAEVLLRYLRPASVSKIYLNFSCPFPKHAYENRRLTNLRFLTIYRELLNETGEIVQKTDNADFFAYSLSQYSLAGCILSDITFDLHALSEAENNVTEYEQKFSSMGMPIYRVRARFPGEKETLLVDLRRQNEVFWLRTALPDTKTVLKAHPDLVAATAEAASFMERAAPLIASVFPEYGPLGGRIVSPLTDVPAMGEALGRLAPRRIPGRIMLKQDNALPVAGSVKARGGIYEVLRFAVTLAVKTGLLPSENDDPLRLRSSEAKKMFSAYSVHVGSTGNLGLSIGSVAAGLGFNAVVHMSADAKQWKKDLLVSRGARVIEYGGDYAGAVASGRREAEADPYAYFVDDESSLLLFAGYALAGDELRGQLCAAGNTVDGEHPLFVYLPCGVGGAPGGVTFGLKQVFGDSVSCFFAEPTAAPCMLLGVLTDRYHAVSVQEIGLSGKTQADGLAVCRCSSLAGKCAQGLVSGFATLRDTRLNAFARLLYDTEGVFIEPSAAAAFYPLLRLFASEEGQTYLSSRFAPQALERAVHVVWATGGSLVPGAERESVLGQA